MEGPQRATLRDERRWHYQHGPIDLVLEAFGEAEEVEAAYDQAWRCFETILPTLVEELSALRRPITGQLPRLHGPTAKRMVAAVTPHRNVFVTPMAAVAGAVADEVLEALVADRELERAYVNNGGDIALFVSHGQQLETGLVTQPLAPTVDGTITITYDMPVRGIATSGRGGRSLSLGIADSVTVLGESSAAADVAATLIANAINVEHPTIDRVPAVELDLDSDLGNRLVTVSVGALDDCAVEEALNCGAERAEALRLSGTIEAALLSLAGRHREVLPSLVRI